jgi:hypothetical protein
MKLFCRKSGGTRFYSVVISIKENILCGRMQGQVGTEKSGSQWIENHREPIRGSGILAKLT